MTMKDLYLRVKDTTGLQVLTVSDMYTMYKNCAADLTSRGYREFKKLVIEEDPGEDSRVDGVTYFTLTGGTKAVFPTPANLRKLLYLKVDMGNGIFKSTRIPITHSCIDTIYRDGEYYFDFSEDNIKRIIHYTNDADLVCEVHEQADEPHKIILGYYGKIDTEIIPTSYTYTNDDNEEVTSTDVYDPDVLETITLPIREELQELFVFYGIYYSYNKRLKEEVMIDRHYKNYKYQVEDLLHELNYEDDFNEEDSVIILEEI